MKAKEGDISEWSMHLWVVCIILEWLFFFTPSDLESVCILEGSKKSLDPDCSKTEKNFCNSKYNRNTYPRGLMLT